MKKQLMEDLHLNEETLIQVFRRTLRSGHIITTAINDCDAANIVRNVIGSIGHANQ